MTNDTAQILANCLDALERPGVTIEQCVAPYPDQRGSLAELLGVAQTLRSTPAVTPSLDFRLDARQRLITHLPTRRSRRNNVVDRFSAWCQRLVRHKLLWFRTAFIFLVGVVFGASVVVASAQSLPNDVLYPMKRIIEQARLIFAPDAVTSGHLHLTFAAERLAEVQSLIDRGRGADAAIAIDDFATHMQSVVAITQNMPDTAERTRLRARVDESMKSSDAVLSRTQERLPESAWAAVKRARAVLVEPLDASHDLQPPLPLLVSIETLSSRTATPRSTPLPTRTWPSIMRGTPRWMPTPVEHHPVNPPTDRPTALPTRQPITAPANWSPYRTLTPSTFVWPQSPTPPPRFGWPRSGGHH